MSLSGEEGIIDLPFQTLSSLRPFRSLRKWVGRAKTQNGSPHCVSEELYPPWRDQLKIRKAHCTHQERQAVMTTPQVPIAWCNKNFLICVAIQCRPGGGPSPWAGPLLWLLSSLTFSPFSQQMKRANLAPGRFSRPGLEGPTLLSLSRNSIRWPQLTAREAGKCRILYVVWY